MWAARILAVSAVVCLSLSCDKDTPVVVPEEPSYVPPLEEKILLAASATQFISGYTEKDRKVTFLFSEPFHFDSIPDDIEQVTLDWQHLLSLVDGQDVVSDKVKEKIRDRLDSVAPADAEEGGDE